MSSLLRNRTLLFLVAVLLGILPLFCGCDREKTPPIRKGMSAPDPGALYLKSDQAVDLQVFRGKPLVLLFFSNSCCADELEKFERLVEEKGTEQFAMLGINVGDSIEEVERIGREEKISFPLGYDPILTTKHRYRLVGLPTIFILDSKGIVLRRLIGRMSYEQLKKEIVETIESGAVSPTPKQPEESSSGDTGAGGGRENGAEAPLLRIS